MLPGSFFARRGGDGGLLAPVLLALALALPLPLCLCVWCCRCRCRWPRTARPGLDGIVCGPGSWDAQMVALHAFWCSTADRTRS
jgi:hypothetical protein